MVNAASPSCKDTVVSIWKPDMSVAGLVNQVHFQNILGFGVLVKNKSAVPERERDKLHPVFKDACWRGKNYFTGTFVGFMRKGLINVFQDVGSNLYPEEFPPESVRYNELAIDPLLIANESGRIDCPETGRRLLENEGDLAVIAIYEPFDNPPGPAVFVHPTALEKMLRCAPNSLLGADKVGSDAHNVYAICSVVAHKGRRVVDEEAGFVLEETFANYLPKANQRRINAEPPF